MGDVLEAIALCKSYQKGLALEAITISVQKGECLGIVGVNGSGKSTLLSILAGMLEPQQGEILLGGKPITKKDRLKIGYVPQTPILMEDLSVLDNLKLWQAIYKVENPVYLDFLKITPMLHKKVHALSGGMKKKVSIAIALMNQPDFLILDEAIAALDIETAQAFVTYLQSNRQMGIICSSHNDWELERLCNRMITLENGKMIEVNT